MTLEPGDVADSVLSWLDYPMVLVTATDGRSQDGCLVGFHTQCSIEPLRYLVCLSQQNRTTEVVARAELLAVQFLGQEDEAVARIFGELTGDTTDKFTRCEWQRGPGGAPIVAVHGGWICGPIVARQPAGDHTAFVIDVTDASPPCSRGQFGFQRAKHLEPGHPA